MHDPSPPYTVGDEFLKETLAIFQSQKDLADRAIAQLSDADLHSALHVETNAIAVIMKHMAGNMRSRWIDFLTTDGEKPDRHRDREFIDDIESRDALLHTWNDGWRCVFKAIESLSPGDLLTTVSIRGEPHSVIRAIHRQISHYGYHVGQIVQIARIHAGDDWAVLTVPRGGSEAYNRSVWRQTDPQSQTPT